jgi:DNA-binding transcriptional ArsR family regulator
MDAFAALGEPRRREILRLVTVAELSAGEIARRFVVSRPAISQHLRVLKETGLVTERRDGTKRLYRARPETLAELRAALEEFWDDSLRSLKAAAEQDEQQRRTRHGRRHESH